MGDIGRKIRAQVREAIEKAAREGHVNIAAAANVSRDGSHTVVYSDDDVMVVQRDGETDVVRRRPGDGQAASDAGADR